MKVLTRPIRRGTQVRVVWEDSTAGPEGWETVRRFDEDPIGVVPIVSLGTVLRDDFNDDCLTVAGHYGRSGRGVAEQFSGAMTIPHRAILSIEPLEPTNAPEEPQDQKAPQQPGRPADQVGDG